LIRGELRGFLRLRLLMWLLSWRLICEKRRSCWIG